MVEVLTTSSLRSEGSTFFGSDGTVTGTAYQLQTIIVIRWAWLTLLISYVTLAPLFLGCIVWWTYSSGMQTLKHSSIATMLAVSPGLRRSLGSLNDYDGLKTRAKTTMVTLENGLWGEGMQFV
jgi:hypothetical protein